MRKLMYLVILGLILSSCSKEEDENRLEVNSLKAEGGGEPIEYVSYDGETTFEDNEYFVNPHNVMGVMHNEIMTEYGYNIGFLEENPELTLEQTYLAATDAYMSYFGDPLPDEIITEEDYINLLDDHMREFNPTLSTHEMLEYVCGSCFPVIEEFADDIQELIDSLELMGTKESSVDYLFDKISIIEQKIYNSSNFDEETMFAYLSFCATFKYSYQQIVMVFSDPEHPLYSYYFGEEGSKEVEISPTAVAIADGWGAIEGACAGAAFGPGGAIFLGVGNAAIHSLGAACVSGVASSIDDFFGWDLW